MNKISGGHLASALFIRSTGIFSRSVTCVKYHNAVGNVIITFEFTQTLEVSVTVLPLGGLTSGAGR
ncbi:hypothetical protein EGR_09906 [Echinococcus granulosus]|uniref:Uncharacterized protein n=1 Tax=Echinococcus granulosus TaxID=6210 RepID=W6U2E9_ECHGR|nr:hypothetical protein EGR_09906 [Echinococcus granulosus]EUB55243.1 hypothetical protein EGR_09906 [Echinococcus granulosus]